MSTVSLLSDAKPSPGVAAVFADIRATRRTDFIINFWRLGLRQTGDRTRNEIDFRQQVSDRHIRS